METVPLGKSRSYSVGEVDLEKLTKFWKDQGVENIDKRTRSDQMDTVSVAGKVD